MHRRRVDHRSERRGRWLPAVGLAAVSCFCSAAFAQPEVDETARVAGTDVRVAVLRDDSVMLDFAAAARAFDWEPKVPLPGQLATVCHTGKAAYCVPVRLVEGKFRDTPRGLFVEADTLGQALGFTVAEKDGGLLLTARPVVRAEAAAEAAERAPSAEPEGSGMDAALPAYNAAWGEGRGFRVGQTLPDIPLYDLEGNEVRFSRFLGKQAIIYCWASW